VKHIFFKLNIFIKSQYGVLKDCPLAWPERSLGELFFIGSLAALEVLLGSMIAYIVSFWIIEINEVFVGIEIMFLN
jgi:hypothetical protein